jgi:hypothetical protein
MVIMMGDGWLYTFERPSSTNHMHSGRKKKREKKRDRDSVYSIYHTHTQTYTQSTRKAGAAAVQREEPNCCVVGELALHAHSEHPAPSFILSFHPLDTPPNPTQTEAVLLLLFKSFQQ